MSDEFAKAIIQAFRDADATQEGCWMDDDDLEHTCIDGWFNLERVAEKLTAMGYGNTALKEATK